MFAAVQMNSGDDIAANLNRAEQLLDAAASRGAKLAVLPENFACMPVELTSRVGFAEDDGEGPIQNLIASIASRLGLWIVAGTIPIRSDDPTRPYSACCVYDDVGQRVGRYDKVHLFDVDVPDSDETYRESDTAMPGDRSLVVDSPWGRLGVAVCYDLRFPELFRHMSSGGLEVIAIPAAFTVPTGQAHWSTLLRARALENLCYVVAAAQTGQHPGGRATYGHSMIVGPWGEIVEEAGSGEACITAGFDRQRLHELRQRFPVLHHRRGQTATGSGPQ